MAANDATASRTRDHVEVIQEARVAARRGFGTQLGLELVDLFVGPERKQFKVHKSLFASRVPYFASMFNGRFVEARENSASFPEDSPEAFELLIEWVYTEGYHCIEEDVSTPELKSQLDIRLALYALAVKICLPTLADLTMTIIFSNLSARGISPGPRTLQESYATLPAISPLLRFMTEIVYHDVFVLSPSQEWGLEDRVHHLCNNPDLLRDIIAIGRSREEPKERRTKPVHPFEQSVCNFHLHGPGYLCEFTGDIF